MKPATSTPDTVVLIHGFWVTPRSWEHWIERYQGRGMRVIAPAYPGFEVEVEELNANHAPIEHLKVPAIIEHLEAIVGQLESPPVIIGHSAGGVFTQILLDHGFGAAGVAINSAPTEGVKRIPLSQVRASFPVLKNPANRHKAVGLTFEQWSYTFTNGLPEDESRRLYGRYHIPASRRGLLGQRAGEHPPRQGRDLGELRQRGAFTAAVHLRQRRPPDAPFDPALERQALERQGDHRGQGVRGPASAARGTRLGEGRRLRARLGARPRGAAEHAVTGVPGSHEPIGFEQHIKPLFRERDRDSMRSRFDLWSLEDVSTHADAILHRVDAGTMPCDGAWPSERVAVFRRWVDAGKPA